MLTKPMDVLFRFPVRKNTKQKQAFRDAAVEYASQLGYACTIEKGSFGVRNVVIGDAHTASYLITAHYDTPARLPFPNLITPCNFWAFMGYQIAITLLLLLPAAAIGVLMSVLTQNVLIGELVYFLLLFGELYWMMLGPANPNTANDNTSGVVTVLEIMRTLPPQLRGTVCFVLFDLEEAGLLGSSAYRKAHKKDTEKQIVLNLDCVGDGNEIVLFPTKKLKKHASGMAALHMCAGTFGEKSIAVHEKGFAIYPSDQKNFPLGVGIAAFRRNKTVGLYCSRIHTPKDTTLEEENVNILRNALISCIAKENQQNTMEEYNETV